MWTIRPCELSIEQLFPFVNEVLKIVKFQMKKLFWSESELLFVAS